MRSYTGGKMEDTKESVATRVKNVLVRNKTRIVYTSVGVLVGVSVANARTNTKSWDFINKVNKSIAETGKYVVEAPNAPWTITATK
jgi:hypothetical protein